jgi:hypothetical protein
LTAVHQYRRERLLLEAETSMSCLNTELFFLLADVRRQTGKAGEKTTINHYRTVHWRTLHRRSFPGWVRGQSRVFSFALPDYFLRASFPARVPRPMRRHPRRTKHPDSEMFSFGTMSILAGSRSVWAFTKVVTSTQTLVKIPIISTRMGKSDRTYWNWPW